MLPCSYHNIPHYSPVRRGLITTSERYSHTAKLPLPISTLLPQGGKKEKKIQIQTIQKHFQQTRALFPLPTFITESRILLGEKSGREAGVASILRARGLGRLANRSHTHTLPIHRNNHRQNTLPSESCQTRFLFLCTAEKKKKAIKAF